MGGHEWLHCLLLNYLTLELYCDFLYFGIACFFMQEGEGMYVCNNSIVSLKPVQLQLLGVATSTFLDVYFTFINAQM